MASTAPSTRRPMNLIEKILFHHSVGLDASTRASGLKAGMCVCVRVSWVMANELTLVAMNALWTRWGKPAPPPRIREHTWLAVDHTVDPRNYSSPKAASLIRLAHDFASSTGIGDFWPENSTIMHTEFARQRAAPGGIVIGADSHTCSAGGMGAFACGLGAADVTVPFVTGFTWFTVPDTILITFTGAPRPGIGGKDVILHVLGCLKRNTVALDRAVEFRGPGLLHLSSDARFAIANMTTEFGGIVGVFEADAITARTMAGRKERKSDGLYFRADPDAEYADRFVIDLGDVVPQIALYPSPDNCKPVPELVGMRLDGCFIGACTTTQEDLILAALLLEAMMADGHKPAPAGQRRVTPGSLDIIEYLRSQGLVAVYEAAGFTVGAPGCSYCLGIAADVAGEGEVWLSSQNRNFKNRMGKGSIANLASAATVAASSFSMTVTDPQPYIDRIDMARFNRLREWIPQAGGCHGSSDAALAPDAAAFTVTEPQPVEEDVAGDETVQEEPSGSWEHLRPSIRGRVQLFEDGVDTDAIIPAQFMGCSPADMVKYGGRADMTDDEFIGTKTFAFVRPEFVGRVREGQTIVVAGNGFGCGSSREEAVRALVATGVQAVIAKSFAFIYSRNQPNFCLLGAVVRDPAFYELVSEGATVSIDVPSRSVTVESAAEGKPATFPFTLSRMEEQFLRGGGVERLFRTFQRRMFAAVMRADAPEKEGCATSSDCGSSSKGGAPLTW